MPSIFLSRDYELLDSRRGTSGRDFLYIFRSIDGNGPGRSLSKAQYDRIRELRREADVPNRPRPRSTPLPAGGRPRPRVRTGREVLARRRGFNRAAQEEEARRLGSQGRRASRPRAATPAPVQAPAAPQGNRATRRAQGRGTVNQSGRAARGGGGRQARQQNRAAAQRVAGGARNQRAVNPRARRGRG